jgi:hypothetical protein
VGDAIGVVYILTAPQTGSITLASESDAAFYGSWQDRAGNVMSGASADADGDGWTDLLVGAFCGGEPSTEVACGPGTAYLLTGLP